MAIKFADIIEKSVVPPTALTSRFSSLLASLPRPQSVKLSLQVGTGVDLRKVYPALSMKCKITPLSISKNNLGTLW